MADCLVVTVDIGKAFEILLKLGEGVRVRLKRVNRRARRGKDPGDVADIGAEVAADVARSKRFNNLIEVVHRANADAALELSIGNPAQPAGKMGNGVQAIFNDAFGAQTLR